jgi:hypothetical protein
MQVIRAGWGSSVELVIRIWPVDASDLSTRPYPVVAKKIEDFDRHNHGSRDRHDQDYDCVYHISECADGGRGQACETLLTESSHALLETFPGQGRSDRG